MHEFNLRPWRILQRRQQSRKLLVTLLSLSLITLTMMIGLMVYVNQQTQQLQAANLQRRQQIQRQQKALNQQQEITPAQRAHWAQIQQDRDYVVRLLAKLNPPQTNDEPHWRDHIQLTQIQWQPPHLKLIGQYRSPDSFQQWLTDLQTRPLSWRLQAQKRDHNHFSLELTRHD